MTLDILQVICHSYYYGNKWLHLQHAKMINLVDFIPLYQTNITTDILIL